MRIACRLPVAALAALAACTPEPRAASVETGVTRVPVVAPRTMRSAPRRTSSPVAKPEPEPEPPVRGMELYARHCAACHGEKGLGDGPGARLLDPRPWNFESAYFKFGTTLGGSSSDEDLAVTIGRGLPGTAMPSFAHLGDDARAELARAVRHLALVATAEVVAANDRERSRGEVLGIARGLVAPAPAFVVPPRPASRPADGAGSLAYERKCKECHGADGTGRDAIETDLRDAFKARIRPRDLTRDPFKAGETAEDVARRFLRGIPGTPMPMTPMPDGELWALADYVVGLRTGAARVPGLAPDAPFAAMRASAELPLGPGDAAWDGAAESIVTLHPLRADPSAPLTAAVRVATCGPRVAVRVAFHGTGAAVLVDVSGATQSVFATDGTVAGARWEADPVTADPPAVPSFVPPSARAWTAGAGAATGVRDDRGAVAVFVFDVPSGGDGVLHLAVSAWNGTTADGRRLESYANWRRIRR